MVRQTLIALLLSTGVILAQTPPPAAQPRHARSTRDEFSDLNPFFNKIWRINTPASEPNSTGIYIFLRNGTLLETSCGETYRVATWKPAKDIPAQLIVTEDGRPAFTATVAAATAKTLNLHQVLLQGDKTTRNLTLIAIDKEFLCPGLPK